MMWIEVDDKRIEATSWTEARRIVSELFPDAILLETIQVNHQRVTHVRRESLRDQSDLGFTSVAVIVEEDFSV